MSSNALTPPASSTPQRVRWACACGRTHDADDVGCPQGGDSAESRQSAALEGAMLKALFPHARQRRRLIQAVGLGTLRAAAAAALPAGALTSLQALAQEPRPLEKASLKVGFLPITCATPLIAAAPLGLYARQGLKVELVKNTGWAPIRDRTISGELDAAHFLAPMPLAATLGLSVPPFPMRVGSIQNNNGSAITLHTKHQGNRDPKKWKGMHLAIPFEHSMHNYLLRYYLAEHGIDPDRDVTLTVMPPPQMVAELKKEAIDGFIVAEPFNQRAVYEKVGFIHLLTGELWDGHPCCSFGVPQSFIEKNPNTFAALYRAIISASVMASVGNAREKMAQAIAVPEYLNQPPELLMSVMTGQFDDGLGHRRSVPDRIMFDPVPWQSLAVWMMTQMRRWGYLKADVDYAKLAEQVFMLTDAKAQMAAAGWRAPEGRYRSHRIMGKTFDANQPREYLASFAIKRR